MPAFTLFPPGEGRKPGILTRFPAQMARAGEKTHPPLQYDTDLLLFLWRKYHDHLPAFHLRKLLDLAVGLEVGLEPFQHAKADILVRHFTAAEAQRDLSLVALVEKLDQVAQLDVVIAIIGAGTELDFLDQDDFLLQLRFVRLLLLR